MKKVVFIGSLVVLLFVCAITTNAGKSHNIKVVNNTGYQMKFFSANQSGDTEWSENELSVAVKDKEIFTTALEGNGNGCAWNIKVMLADKNSYLICKDLDLCKAKVLSLVYDQKTDKLVGKTE